MNKPFFSLLAFFLTLHLAYGAWAQAPDTLYLDLEQTVRLAVRNNPDLKRVKLNQDILEEQIKGAKGLALPQVSASAGYTDNFALPQQLLPGEIFGQEGQIPVKFGVRYGLKAGVEVQQLLFSQDYFANIKKLDAARQTYQLQTLSSMEDLVYNVAQVYIQIQITREQKEILEENLARVDQLVGIAQTQFENGIIKKLDVDQLRVNRTNLQTQLSSLDINARQQLYLLRFYLALDPDQPIALAEKMDNEERVPLYGELHLGENINYRILEQQIRLAELDNDVIRAGYYPTVSAFAQYGYTGQANQFNFNTDNYSDYTAGLWGINVSIPLFDGLQKRRNLEANKLKSQQLLYDKEQLINASEMEFRNSTVKIRQNEELVRTQQENMELARELSDVTRMSYQEGVAPLTELINAESSLNQAQSQYLSALLNFKLAELEHARVSGQLAEMIQSSNF